MKRHVLTGKLYAFTAVAAAVILGGSAMCAQAYPGKVTSSSAKVRASADTNSDTVGSLKSGDSIDILSSTTDSSGQVWYQVNVIGGTGYIRGDLVETSGGGQSSNAASSASSSSNSAASASSSAESQPEVTTVADKAAYVDTTKNSNIRSGPGTGYSTVNSVPGKASVTITGEATGSDGQKWYRIKTSNGTTGFMRADLIKEGTAPASDSSAAASSSSAAAAASSSSAPAESSAAASASEAAPSDNAAADAASEGGNESADEGEGEEAPAPEGEGTEGEAGEAAEGEEGAGDGSEAENAAAAAAAPAMGQQYTVVYEPDSTGQQVAWLYDNNANTRVQVDQLLSAANSSDEVRRIQRQNTTFKVLSIILGVIAAILLVLLILSTIRFRRMMEEEYYEEDEDDRAEERREQMRLERERRDKERAEERARDEERRERERKEREAEREKERRERDAEREASRKEREASRKITTNVAKEASSRSSVKETVRPTTHKTIPASRAVAGAAGTAAADKPRPNSAPPRKPRNFIAEDNDDMEFEFLNVDDE